MSDSTDSLPNLTDPLLWDLASEMPDELTLPNDSLLSNPLPNGLNAALCSLPAGLSTSPAPPLANSSGGGNNNTSSSTVSQHVSLPANGMPESMTSEPAQPQQLSQMLSQRVPNVNVAAMPSAAELSNFINTIRAPSIPGTALQQKQTQIIVQKGPSVATTSSAAAGPVKKQIVSGASGGIQLLNASSLTTANHLTTGSYKVIMTSGGQQILLNANDLCNLQAAVKNNSSGKSDAQLSGGQQKAILSTGSGGQQIVFLSPMKSTTGQQVKLANMSSATATAQQLASASSLKNLAPAPSGSVRLIQATNSSAMNQITKDGKNLQVIRLVTSTGSGGKGVSPATAASLRTIAPSPGQKTFLIPANQAGKSGLTNLIANSTGQQILTTTTSGNSQVIMFPASMLQAGGVIKAATAQSLIPKVSIQSGSSQQQAKSYVPIAPSPQGGHVSTIHPSSKEVLSGLTKQHHQQQHHQNGPVTKTVTIGGNSSFPGLTAEDLSRQRKPCNCTKSQCLKLYCDCFANGEFCKDCNCNNCSNNLEHEEERQKAVRQCLERNPHAFQPKIGKGRITGDVPERRHTKGCNCRRSGCLKNYCECYEAKILCSELCKCCGCKNYEDSFERKSLQLMNLAEAAEYRSQQQSAASKLIWGSDYHAKLPVPLLSSDRFPCSFISTEVVDAACQCLMATVEESAKAKMDYADIEEALILEFGRCLTEIIDSVNKTKT